MHIAGLIGLFSKQDLSRSISFFMTNNSVVKREGSKKISLQGLIFISGYFSNSHSILKLKKYHNISYYVGYFPYDTTTFFMILDLLMNYVGEVAQGSQWEKYLTLIEYA